MNEIMNKKEWHVVRFGQLKMVRTEKVVISDIFNQ